MTQKEMILEYLQKVKKEGLTAKEAEDYFGCMRLASRISDLKRDGYFINSEKIKVRTRRGFTWVSCYTLNEG